MDARTALVIRSTGLCVLSSNSFAALVLIVYPAIDPTKLTKPRQFARTAAPSRNVDTSLWTETPAERQQRLADEVAGKRRRAVNADPDALDESAELEARKRRRHDEEIRQGVNEYSVRNIFTCLSPRH